jgi:hypothetical protein
MRRLWPTEGAKTKTKNDQTKECKRSEKYDERDPDVGGLEWKSDT